MLTKGSISRLFTLGNIGLSLPCFYGIVLFIYSYDDIINPSTPTYIKIFKDLILITIIIKGIIKILIDSKLNIKLFYFINILIIFLFYIIALNYLKGWTNFSDFNFIKNYFFYISGLLFVYVYGSEFTENLLRKLLLIVISIGIIFLLISYLTNFTFMYQDRSISTFLNPNFLGYILTFQFVLICFSLKENSVFINIILLGTTKSISSILFILILLIIFSFNTRRVNFEVKNYSRIFLILIILILFCITFLMDSSFTNKINYILGLDNSPIVYSTSLDGRLLSYTTAWMILTESYTSLFFGSNNEEMFEWDSGAINILYNYGVIGFFLWMLIFIYPILVGLNSFKVKPYLLSIFLLLSFIIFYSTQYVTQFYPTNFFIAIIIGLILFSTDSNQFVCKHLR